MCQVQRELERVAEEGFSKEVLSSKVLVRRSREARGQR